MPQPSQWFCAACVRQQKMLLVCAASEMHNFSQYAMLLLTGKRTMGLYFIGRLRLSTRHSVLLLRLHCHSWGFNVCRTVHGQSGCHQCWMGGGSQQWASHDDVTAGAHWFCYGSVRRLSVIVTMCNRLDIVCLHTRIGVRILGSCCDESKPS